MLTSSLMTCWLPAKAAPAVRSAGGTPPPTAPANAAGPVTTVALSSSPLILLPLPQLPASKAASSVSAAPRSAFAADMRTW